MTVAVTALGSAVIARHRAQSAADLAALAAAATVGSGTQQACAAATSVAAAVSTRLLECAVHDLDVVVTVAADTGLRGWRAQARARAGPTTSVVGIG